MEILWVLLVILPLFFLIAAVVLRSACRLTGVRVPDTMRAVAICIAAGLADFIPGWGIELAVDNLRTNTGLLPLAVAVGGIVAHFVVAAIVGALVYMLLLDIGFGKGLLVYLMQILVMIFIIGSVLAIMAIVAGGFELPDRFRGR